MKTKITSLLVMAGLLAASVASAASVYNAKKASGFTGKTESIEVVYDYSKDGGSTGALTLLTASKDIVVHRVVAKILTAPVPTPSTTPTVSIGKSGDTAGLMSATAYSDMALGGVVDSKKGAYKLSAGDAMIQTIGTANLIGGKIKYWIEYSGF